RRGIADHPVAVLTVELAGDPAVVLFVADLVDELRIDLGVGAAAAERGRRDRLGQVRLAGRADRDRARGGRLRGVLTGRRRRRLAGGQTRPLAARTRGARCRLVAAGVRAARPEAAALHRAGVHATGLATVRLRVAHGIAVTEPLAHAVDEAGTFGAAL